MPVIINASTSTGLVQSADTSGEINLQSNGTTVLGVTSTGASVTGTQSVSGNLSFNSGYGSAAVAYGCRAWVHFNGQGTVSIIGSGNVSSIGDQGVGNYQINFTNSMPDSTYAPFYSDWSWGNGYPDTLNTTHYRVTSLTSSFSVQDVAKIFTGIFR